MSYEVLPFRVTLTKPDASTLDITDRVMNDSAVVMQESVEEGLGELRHGDISITLDDRDNVLYNLFQTVDPDDTYQVLIERRTSPTDAAWLKVFVGVLDFPWSVEIDTKNQTVKFQVFSYSKILEKTDASTVKRTFDATIIASVVADSDAVTLSTGTTANMARGDMIQLEDEQQRIKTINSTTSITTIGTFRDSHTSVPLVVTTPYYRNKSLEWLVDTLFDTAGLSSNTIDMDYDMSTLPFMTGFSDAGLPSWDLDGLTPYSDDLGVWIDNNRYVATAPESGFGTATSQTNRADWTRYLATEPTSIVAGDALNDAGYDHTNGYEYTAEWYHGAPSDNYWHLELWRNGSFLSEIARYFDLNLDYDGYIVHGVDYDPTSNRVWVSYEDYPQQITRTTKYYSVSGGTWTSVIDAGPGNMVSVALESKVLFHSPESKILRLYSAASPSTATDPTLEYPDGNPLIKTVQVLGNYLVGIVRKEDLDYLCIWNKTTRVIEQFVAIGPYQLTPSPRICRWTYDGNSTCVMSVGGAMWILSTKFLGTVPYADFSDMSVQTALKELAIASGAWVYVDLSKVGKFTSRFSTTPIFNAVTHDLEATDKYEKRQRPVWTWYRNRVEVTGQALDDGEEVKQIMGSNAYSSRVATVSSEFIQSNSQAAAVAQMYLTWLSQIREERNYSVPEPAGKLIHILDLVDFGGLGAPDYQVLRVDSDLAKRVQRILVVEVI